MSGKVLFYIFSIAIIVHCCLASPANLFDFLDEFQSSQETDTKYRLPATFIPESYKIKISEIKFDQEKGGSFNGFTEVVFTAKEDADELMIHSFQLEGTNDVKEVELHDNEVPPEKIDISFDETIDKKYQMLKIKPKNKFIKDQKYTLTFKKYTGSMKGLSGFYQSTYKNNDAKTEILGTTQMQPVSARQVFPCFDEPSYKAKFSLSIENPSDYHSYSNMKLKPATPEKNLEEFEETPVMSTYLLAFIVSKFQELEKTDNDEKTFRILGRPNAEGQGKYAFDIGMKQVEKMGDYLAQKYWDMGNKKMDQAALPDFSAGAMENWGLLIYRESYLLYDDSKTNIRYKQSIDTILAHEIAHMWFGNALTCHWWSDTWLNEGFATYFQYKLPDLAETDEKEQFNLNLQFPVVVVERALIGDTSINSAPLSNPNVNSPEEIMGHFSVISYSKGASILRMVEHWIGEDNFKAAITEYVKTYTGKTVTPENLYSELKKKAGEKNVEEMMKSWVDNSGFPLLTVTVNHRNKNMDITQTRFKKAWEEKQDTVYQVPITYATKKAKTFKDLSLMTSNVTNGLEVDIDGEQWLVLNKQRSGFYRVNYDSNTWDILIKALMGNERTEIEELNRAQIVDDVFNLAKEDVITYNRTLDVLEFLVNEDEYGPWTAAYDGFSFIRQQFIKKPSLLKKMDNHIKHLMEKVINKLGFKDDGNNLQKLFRLNTMNFACSLGEEKCVNYTKEVKDSIPANHREFVYCTKLRDGNDKDFDSMWTQYKAENVVNEKMVILHSLGCSRDLKKIHELLDEISKISGSEIRDQDVYYTINGILHGNPENVENVLQYMENDFPKLKQRLVKYTTMFTILGTKLTGNQIYRFHALLTKNMNSLADDEKMAGFNAYVNLASQSSYVIKAGEVIESWLDEKYKGAGALASSSFILLCAMLLIQLFNIEL